MKQFHVQMLDHAVSSQWWRRLIAHFVRAGDPFEIRCWREEAAAIEKASLYGTAVEDHYEVSVKGAVTRELLEAWLTEEPADRSTYHKMTNFFTIHVENELCSIWSEHYGTEMAIVIRLDADVAFFEAVMRQYAEHFSIGTIE